MSVRVRFAPSPSGDLHVGNVRTALYNWAFARHEGGAFVFRVEDTDRSRVTDEGYHGALSTLRWLGLDWDEGPEVGGPFAPYRQSERLERYAEAVTQLRGAGAAYPCFCTTEEVAVRAKAAGRERQGYDGHCRTLHPEEVAAMQAEGRRPVVRFRMPEGETRFDDLIRGEVIFDHEHVPDFALTRADGHPLYTLANPVDDVAMEITHVLRGEDLLSSTPRQIALYRALGVPVERMPRFGHLPFVMGQDNAKLSKRHGEVSIAFYRREGFLPEAMVNYLALLGWSFGADREDFTLAEMVAAFDIGRVGRNPARFDVRKLEALNADKIRALEPADFTRRLGDALAQAGLIAAPPTVDEAALVAAAAPLVQTRITRLGDAADLLRFLFTDELVLDPSDAARMLIPEAAEQLRVAATALDAVRPWEAAAIQATLRDALVDRLGLKPKVAFSPLYVAVCGRRVGPPVFDSMALLGRGRTVARVQAAAERAAVG